MVLLICRLLHHTNLHRSRHSTVRLCDLARFGDSSTSGLSPRTYGIWMHMACMHVVSTRTCSWSLLHQALQLTTLHLHPASSSTSIYAMKDTTIHELDKGLHVTESTGRPGDHTCDLQPMAQHAHAHQPFHTHKWVYLRRRDNLCLIWMWRLNRR